MNPRSDHLPSSLTGNSAKSLNIKGHQKGAPLYLTTQRGFSLNQILQEIESIYKFKDLVPISEGVAQQDSALKIP